MGKISWPQVVVFVVSVAVVGALLWRGVDTGAITAFILALVGGLLYARQDQIKDQTNGRLSELVELARRQSDQLAQSHPPARATATSPVYDAERVGDAPPSTYPSAQLPPA